MATPDAINFMARHGRGLICLALTQDRVDALGLQPMTQANRSRNETAFTVSIEARDGHFDGHQRRRPRAHHRGRDRRANGPTRWSRPATSSPGRPPGRRAGPRRPYRSRGRRLAPRRAQSVGVICEIMREDGTMARLDD
jgi:3,4-dihydroxy 2-butanone 4-phosphate synthase/GTP cyclohydrolase II